MINDSSSSKHIDSSMSIIHNSTTDSRLFVSQDCFIDKPFSCGYYNIIITKQYHQVEMQRGKLLNFCTTLYLCQQLFS